MTSPATGPGRTATRIALRALLFVGVTAGITLTSPADADGLGVGLLVFTVQAALALTLGLVDGWRRPRPRTMLEWTGVAALSAVLGGLYTALPIGYDQPWTWQTISEGLANQLDPVFLPFMIGLVAVPALVGVALGSFMSPRRGSSVENSVNSSLSGGSADMRLPG